VTRLHIKNDNATKQVLSYRRKIALQGGNLEALGAATSEVLRANINWKSTFLKGWVIWPKISGRNQPVFVSLHRSFIWC